jgi:hypothetical protein
MRKGFDFRFMASVDLSPRKSAHMDSRIKSANDDFYLNSHTYVIAGLDPAIHDTPKNGTLRQSRFTIVPLAAAFTVTIETIFPRS